MYSDDRPLISPSLAEVATMATDCRECSRRTSRIIRADKQECSLINTSLGCPILVATAVQQHTGTTSAAPREVDGILILPELPLLSVINKCCTALDRAHKASRNREACPIL